MCLKAGRGPGGDELVEGGDLVAEFENPAGQRLQRDPGGADRSAALAGRAAAAQVRISCILVRLRT
jgi:hypothetical protein